MEREGQAVLLLLNMLEYTFGGSEGSNVGWMILPSSVRCRCQRAFAEDSLKSTAFVVLMASDEMRVVLWNLMMENSWQLPSLRVEERKVLLSLLGHARPSGLNLAEIRAEEVKQAKIS